MISKWYLTPIKWRKHLWWWPSWTLPPNASLYTSFEDEPIQGTSGGRYSTPGGSQWPRAGISKTKRGGAVTGGASRWAVGWAWDRWDTAAGQPWGLGRTECIAAADQHGWGIAFSRLIREYAEQRRDRNKGSHLGYSQGSSLTPLDGQHRAIAI